MSKSIHTPEHQALRELLVAARKAAGLTQQQVAEGLDRPQSFVAKYEGGERRLDVIEFLAVAKVLGTDPKAVVGRLLSVGVDKAGRPARR